MGALSEKIAGIDLPGVLESEGIQLRRCGNSFQFPCPFHADKHPSVSLRRQDKWLWHCFGCGEGGDAADFIKKRYNLDFKGEPLAVIAYPVSMTRAMQTS